MLFAGLYESRYLEKDRPELTFTIVTCAANALIAVIHDRMPVVLDELFCRSENWRLISRWSLACFLIISTTSGGGMLPFSVRTPPRTCKR